MRIGLVGPTYPYRGGIAHHTTLLCQELKKSHEVKFISYSRQYPAFLYPGKSDKDPSENPITVDGVEYLIDSCNPITWVKAAEELVRFEAERVVIPWWVVFWAPLTLFLMMWLKLRSRAEITVLCHNVIEHEASFWKALLTKMVLFWADHIITQSKEETAKVLALLPEKTNITTAFHPTYAPLAQETPTKEEAKKSLGLAGDVILFFGFVRHYKGLDILYEAMPHLLKERDVTLLVVGEFWKDRQRYFSLIDELDISASVCVEDRYVSNEEMSIFFHGADLVVQPYRSASGSGICQIAYGLDRPVVATNVGCLPEIISDKVNGRLVRPNDPRALARAIAESLDGETLTKLTAHARETKEKFSWQKLSALVCAA